MKCKLVEAAKIPLAEDVPLDNLMEIYRICQGLQILCEERNGIGISAVQAGIPMKLFLIKHPDTMQYHYYVNCEYVPLSEEKVVGLEGCLSLPRKNFRVKRFSKVKITGHELIAENDLYLKTIDGYNVEGYVGIVFQHEIDHQNGTLISEIGEEVNIWR